MKLRDKSAGYAVKIYALGNGRKRISRSRSAGRSTAGRKDIAGANGGRGEEFTEAFEVEKTDAGFTTLGRRGESAAGRVGGRGDRAAGGDPGGGQIPAGDHEAERIR